MQHAKDHEKAEFERKWQAFQAQQAEAQALVEAQTLTMVNVPNPTQPLSELDF